MARQRSRAAFVVHRIETASPFARARSMSCSACAAQTSMFACVSPDVIDRA
jgi:hypothetical protein